MTIEARTMIGAVVLAVLGAGCDGAAQAPPPPPPPMDRPAPPVPALRTATFTPPPALGEVYTVFHYRGQDGQASPTRVSVVWGHWNHSDLVTPPRSADARGFVVKLRHTGETSVGLTFETDGAITGGPLQGAPPPEWTSEGYQQVAW